MKNKVTALAAAVLGLGFLNGAVAYGVERGFAERELAAENRHEIRIVGRARYRNSRLGTYERLVPRDREDIINANALERFREKLRNQNEARALRSKESQVSALFKEKRIFRKCLNAIEEREALSTGRLAEEEPT
jgi:hypothetical protein